jgi:hypothetical protein
MFEEEKKNVIHLKRFEYTPKLKDFDLCEKKKNKKKLYKMYTVYEEFCQLL